MTALQELIERLEKACTLDEVQEASIAVAKFVGTYREAPYPEYPPYCESTDAAMTLVPPNWTGCLDGIGSHGVIARFGPPASDAEFSGEHSLTAIALCICILKSREAQ